MSISQFVLFFSLVSVMTVWAESSSYKSVKTYSVRSEVVSFKNGDVTLKGTLHLPESSEKHPAIVAFHGAIGGKRDYPFYEHLTKDIPSKGFGVLLFDRRGSGESNGDFETADFDDLASDGIAGIELLKTRKEIDADKIGVWGVSQGGWIGPLAATKSADISFVIIVSGTDVSPAEQMNFAAEFSMREAGFQKKEIDEAIGLRELENSYYRGNTSKKTYRKAMKKAQKKPWFKLAFLSAPEEIPDDPKITKWFREMDYDPLPPLRKVKVPILVFFGENDRWIPIDESIKTIKEATRKNKRVEIHRLQDADHLMMTGVPDSNGPVSKEYIDIMLDWLKKQNAK